ncbi:MAG: hypothetical protein ACC645_18885, partial [Pirellulales bacterium]
MATDPVKQIDRDPRFSQPNKIPMATADITNAEGAQPGLGLGTIVQETAKLIKLHGIVASVWPWLSSARSHHQ